jgi:hypothetical protein
VTVALFRSGCFQDIGEATNLGVKLAVGVPARLLRWLVGLPDDGCVIATGGEVPVHAVGADVQNAVGKPANAEAGFVEARLVH